MEAKTAKTRKRLPRTPNKLFRDESVRSRGERLTLEKNGIVLHFHASSQFAPRETSLKRERRGWGEDEIQKRKFVADFQARATENEIRLILVIADPCVGPAALSRGNSRMGHGRAAVSLWLVDLGARVRFANGTLSKKHLRSRRCSFRRPRTHTCHCERPIENR